MSTVTPNLGLIKPGDSEYIDVADLNANFDTLDAAWLAQDIIRVTDSDPLDPVTAVSTGQIQFKDNSVWKGLDEVRLYNNSDALYCKDGVTTGLLMQNNQIKIVPVTWNNGVPAVGTAKGYIDANGDYHSANTSLETLRESVNSFKNSFNTWTTLAVGDWITLNSGFEIPSFNVKYNAALHVVQGIIHVRIKQTTSTSAGDVTFGTIKAKYRPAGRTTFSSNEYQPLNQFGGPLLFSTNGTAEMVALPAHTSGNNAITMFYSGEYTIV